MSGEFVYNDKFKNENGFLKKNLTLLFLEVVVK
jgi:hypothetical protein